MKAIFLFFCCLVILIIGLLFPAFYTKTVHDHVDMTNELTPSVYWGAFIHNGQIDYICSSEKNLTEKEIKYYQFEEQVSLSSFWNMCSIGFYSISESQSHDRI